MGDFMLKVHSLPSDTMVAVCDSDILGKTFFHNDAEILVNPRFYGDIDYFADEALTILQNATQINAIGNKIVALLVQEQMIHEDMIIRLDPNGENIAHSIIIR